VHVKQQKCSGRLVTGTIKFTTAGNADRASISRGNTVYAAGVSASTGRGGSQLVLTDLRPLRRGNYTLTLRTRHARRWVTRRVEITID
jgi:hypothetical protein